MATVQGIDDNGANAFIFKVLFAGKTLVKIIIKFSKPAAMGIVVLVSGQGFDLFRLCRKFFKDLNRQ